MSRDKRSDVSKMDRRDFLRYAAITGGIVATGGLAGLGCAPSAPATPTTKPAASGATAVTSAPAAAAGSKVAEVKIGVIHPLTGAAALDGAQCNNGVLLAFEQANAAGGIKSMGGAKITVLQGDHQGKPEVAAAEAQRLIQQGALALMGAFQAPMTMSSSLESEKAKVPYMGTIIAADEYSERGFNYVYRVQPRSINFAESAVKHLQSLSKATNTPIKTIAMIHDSQVGMNQTATSIEKLLPSAGYQLVQRLQFPTGTADFTSELNKIKGAKPDIVLAMAFFADGLLIARTYKELRIDALALMGVQNGAFSNPQFIKEFGKDADGVIDVNYWYNPKSPKTAVVGAEFEKRYGQRMSSHVVQAYVAAQVVIDALERAGKADRDALNEALKKTNFKDHIFPQAEISFDSKGDNLMAMAPMMQIQGGLSKVVFPDEYAEAKPIFPVK